MRGTSHALIVSLLKFSCWNVAHVVGRLLFSQEAAPCTSSLSLSALFLLRPVSADGVVAKEAGTERTWEGLAVSKISFASFTTSEHPSVSSLTLADTFGDKVERLKSSSELERAGVLQTTKQTKTSRCLVLHQTAFH